jgi:hypothetical protein
MFRGAPAAATGVGAEAEGPDSLTVLSKLPPLLRLPAPPKNSGIIRDIGRRLKRGAFADDMPKAGIALAAGTVEALFFLEVAPKVVFSSSALEYCSFSLRFLPRNQSSKAAMIPITAMIAMARPAFAPVDMPLLLELELVVESEEPEVEAAPAIAVLETVLDVT